MVAFINSFLKCNGISCRRRYTISIPAGHGCGEAFVRRRLPNEVKLLHVKKHLRLALIACTDADTTSFDKREKMLLDEIIKEIPNWNYSDEMLIIWIPKREIETWIEFFKGTEVDEEMDFRHGGDPVSCKVEAEKMYVFCQGEIKYDHILPSLAKAKESYERVCDLQRRMG